VRWQVEDPFSRRLVLPLTRLEQVANHGLTTGTTHTLRRLRRWREPEHAVAIRHEDLQQLGPEESIGARHERRRLLSPSP
jgi:hypothetical protein